MSTLFAKGQKSGPSRLASTLAAQTGIAPGNIVIGHGSDEILGLVSLPVMSAMAAEGVFVREWRDPGFESFIRITVGLPEENDRALRSLTRAATLELRTREGPPK